MVRELSKHQSAFLFDCCVFIARFASSSCYSSAKTRIRLVKSYHKISKVLPVIKWTEPFQDFLNRKIGNRNIPLAYIIHEVPNPPAAAPPLTPGQPHSLEYGSVEAELIARVSDTFLLMFRLCSCGTKPQRSENHHFVMTSSWEPQCHHDIIMRTPRIMGKPKFSWSGGL